MANISFEEVKLAAKKSWKCGRGKRCTKQTTFSQTINPFNKNKNGMPKTRYEINEELMERRAVWVGEKMPCGHVNFMK